MCSQSKDEALSLLAESNEVRLRLAQKLKSSVSLTLRKRLLRALKCSTNRFRKDRQATTQGCFCEARRKTMCTAGRFLERRALFIRTRNLRRKFTFSQKRKEAGIRRFSPVTNRSSICERPMGQAR